MKKQADRRAIVTSAVLTLLILLGIGGALLWQGNRLAAAASDGSASIAQSTDSRQAVAPLAVESAAASTKDPVVAAYQAQLQEAYQALNEAYTQIDALQAAQAPASAQFYDKHDDDAREHGAKAKSSGKEHDDHERDDHKSDNHERDDD